MKAISMEVNCLFFLMNENCLQRQTNVQGHRSMWQWVEQSVQISKVIELADSLNINNHFLIKKMNQKNIKTPTSSTPGTLGGANLVW